MGVKTKSDTLWPGSLKCWPTGRLVTGLYNRVPVAHKPLLSSLASLTTVLWIVWACPVSLHTGPNVQDVGGGTGDVAPDGHLLTCTAYPHCL